MCLYYDMCTACLYYDMCTACLYYDMYSMLYNTCSMVDLGVA